MKFKVGDKVKVVYSYISDDTAVGATGTVVNVSNRGSLPYDVEFDGAVKYYNKVSHFDEDELELIEEAPTCQG